MKKRKATLSQRMQLGRHGPTTTMTWEEYQKVFPLLKGVCTLVNSTLKRCKEPPMYLIDNGGYAGAEAMTVLHEGKEEDR